MVQRALDQPFGDQDLEPFPDAVPRHAEIGRQAVLGDPAARGELAVEQLLTE